MTRSNRSAASLPRREVPLDPAAVKEFRGRYRERFEGQPAKSRVYRDVSDGIAHGGIEYYLPLFFETTAGLLDYLPASCPVLAPAGLEDVLTQAENEINERYDLASLDPERPILTAEETFHPAKDILTAIRAGTLSEFSNRKLGNTAGNIDLGTQVPPALRIEARYEDAAARLMQFLGSFEGRVLFTTDSAGRREQVHELLSGRGLDLIRVDSWFAFLASEHRIGVSIAPLDSGFILADADVALISEQQLFGDRVRQRKRKRYNDRDPETIIRQLSDLEAGSPVVHAEYGVGRYLGLETDSMAGLGAMMAPSSTFRCMRSS